MTDEGQWMSQFAANGSDEAFASILKLHVNLVFSAAMRQLGDRGLAEEVTQNVFLALAKNAGALDGSRTLAGWLYQTTLNQSRHLLRTELRRRKREEIATACAEISSEDRSTSLVPLLDEALLSLGEPDRLAVILHYMEGHPFREVGARLGVGEDAARKRVNRATQWLTRWFRQRGFSVTSTALIAALSLEGAPAASAALVTSIVSATASLSPATATAGFISTFGFIMASTKTKIAAGATLLALLVSAPLALKITSERKAKRAAEDSVVLSNPSGTPAASPAQRAELFSLTQTNRAAQREMSVFERINGGDESLSILSREQADSFVARNRGNAESLLAAYRVTHDLEYLRQAATNFPNDPAVLFRAAAHNAFPEEKREWLDRYKQADSSNSLPYYLSAADHLKNGNLDAAFEDLGQAAEKTAFQDRVTENILTLEEIYLSAGYSSADAKALATGAVELPHLSQLNEMSRTLVDLMKQYRQTGDSASVQNLAAMGVKLASHLGNIQEGGNLLGQIVAVRTERSFLEQLDPSQSYSFLGTPVTDRIAAGRNREQALRSDADVVNRWVPEATEADIVNYFDRLKLYGETAAIDWLKNRSK